MQNHSMGINILIINVPLCLSFFERKNAICDWICEKGSSTPSDSINLENCNIGFKVYAFSIY